MVQLLEHENDIPRNGRILPDQHAASLHLDLLFGEYHGQSGPAERHTVRGRLKLNGEREKATEKDHGTFRYYVLPSRHHLPGHRLTAS